jgi:hypothetical protein
MTISDFDPRNLTLYEKPRDLLHFQWQSGNKVYRYALVEIIDPINIDSRTKLKRDEQSLSHKEIWKKYGISSRYL